MCVLTGLPLTDPVKNKNCRHVFNRQAIINYMRRHRTCPVCKVYLSIHTNATDGDMSRSGLNTGSSPQFRKASRAGGSGSSNNFINSSSFNDRSKSRVNSTGLLWNPGTLSQDISYREGATKRKKKKRGLVYHHESGLSKKRKKREKRGHKPLEDSEDDDGADL